MQFSNFTTVAIDLLRVLGYGGLAAGLVIDSFGIPIPSEVLLLLGGALAASGRFNLWAVFVIGVVAQVIGGLIGYAIGKYGGLPLLERYGKYILVSKKDLAKTHAAFEKYGAWMTMIGRCVPVIRGLIGYPAGIAGMRLDLFIIYTAVGSAVWSALFVTIGYTIGGNLSAVSGWMNKFSLVVVVLVAGAIAWHFREIIQTFGRRKGKSADSGR